MEYWTEINECFICLLTLGVMTCWINVFQNIKEKDKKNLNATLPQWEETKDTDHTSHLINLQINVGTKGKKYNHICSSKTL